MEKEWNGEKIRENQIYNRKIDAIATLRYGVDYAIYL